MALDNASNIVTLNMHPENNLASPILTETERKAMYHIHRWNGSPGLKHWGYKDVAGNKTAKENTRCNMIEGAFEGTIFPILQNKNSSFKLYRRAFCRPVVFTYEKDTVTNKGFDGYQFRVNEHFLSNPEENPENACYCHNGICLSKGLASLAPCYYDIPVTISQPHFYNADPWLLKQVDGMKPNKTLHDSIFVMHKGLGIPLEADLKIQLNLDVGQTKYNAQTKPFNGLMLPLFYLQMTISQTPWWVNTTINLAFHILPVVQVVLIYLLGLGGLAVISGSALIVLFFRSEPNGRLSFKSDYSPIPVLPIHSQYFKRDFRISK